MTRIELHKMIQELQDFTSKMDRENLQYFEMLLKRDRDDEDLDSAAVSRLQQLHSTYVTRKTKSDAEKTWKKLTGKK